MLREEINKALEVLKNGGLILYPTDTVWGIGCDATNAEAVTKIYALKARDVNKSMTILLDTENKLQSYVADVPDIAYDLIEYTEKPLTIIYSNAKNVAANLVSADGSIGIRIPKHEFCQQLIQRFRKPIVSTSANLSGQLTPSNFSEIDNDILEGVDLVIDLEQSVSEKKEVSTVMKLEADGRFVFLRR